MPSAQVQPIPCDSCGLPANPQHIADRLARLELATRYRPVHISTLLVCTAPPARLEDDLYAWERNSASTEARKSLASLLACAGISPAKSPADQLAEFQRLGFYLAHLVECPLDFSAPHTNLAKTYGPTLAKRIQFSYKPRRVAILDPVPEGLPEILASADLADLLVNGGQGIAIPSANNSADVQKVRALFCSE